MEKQLIFVVYSFPIIYTVYLTSYWDLKKTWKIVNIALLWAVDTSESDCPIRLPKLWFNAKAYPEQRIKERPDTSC